MKKILILHRSDLFNLTSDLPIGMISVEHFKIPLKDYEDAEFIAFEEFGLIKILKNVRGRLATMPYVSFLMAINMATTPNSLLNEVNDEYFIPDGNSSFALPRDYLTLDKIRGITKEGDQINYVLPDTPGPRFILGFDPAHKDQPGGVIAGVSYDPLNVDNPKSAVVIYKQEDDKYIQKFHQEVIKTSQYYGHQLLEDYNDEINSSVATAIEMGRPEMTKFPETLSEAILYFNHYFNELPLLAFQKMEITFTLKLKISNPEIYARIKKECGFWCQDTALYKNLSYIYKCDHEECLLNTILKGIYRYRNFGRDTSGDFTDVINSYKP